MSESDPGNDAEIPDARPPAEPKRRMPKVGGASIGSAMVGFEAAVFRTLPPPIEVVEQSRHDGPMVTGDGTILTITLPAAVQPAEPEESPPSDE